MGDIGGFSFDMDPDVVKDLASAEYIMPDGTLIVSDRSAPHRHGAIGHNVGYGFFEDAVNAVQRDWWEEEAHSLIEYEWGDEEEFGEFDSDSERYREIGQDILGHIENDDDWTAKIARKCVEMFLEQSGAIRHATVVDEGSSYYYSPKYCDADFECGPKGMTRAQAIVIVKHVNRMLKDGCDSVSFIVEGPTFDLIQDRYLSKPLNVDWLLKETGTIEQQCECIEGYEPCCPKG